MANVSRFTKCPKCGCVNAEVEDGIVSCVECGKMPLTSTPSVATIANRSNMMAPRTYCKEGVRIQGIQPEMCFGLTIVSSNYHAMGYDCVITSANDGEHSEKSLHWAGAALDFRIKHMAEEDRWKLAHILQEALPDDFDVVLESDHIHIEYQPKR
jgi:uncharacterized protein YcbK (DUF882 family)